MDILGEEYRLANKGVPQGGVLSLQLYTIYASSITKYIPKIVKVSEFADDLDVYSSFSPLSKCRITIEKAVIK